MVQRTVCKTVYAGSNPAPVSSLSPFLVIFLTFSVLIVILFSDY